MTQRLSWAQCLPLSPLILLFGVVSSFFCCESPQTPKRRTTDLLPPNQARRGSEVSSLLFVCWLFCVASFRHSTTCIPTSLMITVFQTIQSHNYCGEARTTTLGIRANSVRPIIVLLHCAIEIVRSKRVLFSLLTSAIETVNNNKKSRTQPLSFTTTRIHWTIYIPVVYK